ncbi:DHH family phosphoesterase [Bacillus solimangrovi]|uniref:Oligoribonuclease n=1 Tax=Bacillus solimangrovi TaxID=1305675 RepID=A0A1E5LCN8_9BACI|nr:bifunctional oligoribonuclease/PAP phosphatase NrnA [Bacillus solimangrovi]OEH91848.1 oligoribonuclease [Bacillus solimangrovi]
MKQDILNEIKKFDTIIIHRHVRPDPDALGSQGGLGEIIKASFPDKNVYLTGEEEEGLTFLVRMDEVSDDMYNGALVIVCDTANQERISDSRYNKGERLIKIDHHPNRDVYGDLVWVDTDASATSELIYEFYEFGKEQGLVLTEQAARLLFAGIVGDTGRFLFPSTNINTFKYASELVKKGINFSELYTDMYKMSPSIARLNGFILQNFSVTDEGVAAVSLTKELLAEYNLTANETSKTVGVLGNIDGVLAWVFFVEEDDQIRVRLRSRGPIINTVAQKYNGGGHPLASGATIYEWSEAENVIADLDKACAEFNNN